MSVRDAQQQAQRPLHIVITGSSQGIGLAAAKTLLSQGHVVYHACRSTDRAREAVDAAGGGIALAACDLSDLDSVQACARDIQERVPTLDVLCLNAGLFPSASAKVPKLTAQGFEEGIGVNHLGHFLLAQLLCKKLAADGGGRLVITASPVHDPDLPAGKSGGNSATLGDLSGFGVNLKEHPDGPTMIDGTVEYVGQKVYKDAKLCNILMCRQAAKSFPSSVTSVCFSPGFIPTTGLFSSFRQESWWKAQAFTLFASFMGISVPLEVGGDRLVYMATAPGIANGTYFSAPSKSHATAPGTGGKDGSGFAPTAVSKEASNDELAAQLWEKSLKIVSEWM